MHGTVPYREDTEKGLRACECFQVEEPGSSPSHGLVHTECGVKLISCANYQPCVYTGHKMQLIAETPGLSS